MSRRNTTNKHQEDLAAALTVFSGSGPVGQHNQRAQSANSALRKKSGTLGRSRPHTAKRPPTAPKLETEATNQYEYTYIPPALQRSTLSLLCSDIDNAVSTMPYKKPSPATNEDLFFTKDFSAPKIQTNFKNPLEKVLSKNIIKIESTSPGHQTLKNPKREIVLSDSDRYDNILLTCNRDSFISFKLSLL